MSSASSSQGSSNTHVLDMADRVCRQNAVLPEKKQLIHSGFLYCADEGNQVIPNAWVLVKGKHIEAFGSMDEPIPDADLSIDARGQMILPGFVNPHWHESFAAPNHEPPNDSGLTPTPYSNGGNIEALGAMSGFIAGLCKKITLEEGRAIARWSLWTQLRSGSTALGDLGSANDTDALALAALDMGIRLRVSRWGTDIMIRNGTHDVVPVADTQEQTDDWLALLETWNDHPSGLIGGMPSIVGGFCSSDAQLLALKDVSHQFDAPYAAHLSALKSENPAIQAAFGCRSVERFHRLGLLTPRLMVVHTAYASDQEYRWLLENDVNICHAPAHYGILGESSNSETKRFGQLLRDGVWVSSSSDGDINYTGGMCEAMRGALLNHSEALNCNTVCPPTLALKTGTLFGAKALGWLDRIGSVEVGKEADLVLVNIDDYRYYTTEHPLRIFLLAGSSADVDTVMVQGNILVRQGKSTRFDEKALFDDYQKAAASVRRRIQKPE